MGSLGRLLQAHKSASGVGKSMNLNIKMPKILSYFNWQSMVNQTRQGIAGCLLTAHTHTHTHTQSAGASQINNQKCAAAMSNIQE